MSTTRAIQLENFTPADIARFWRHVVVTGPDDCWIWLGCCHKKTGYGSFKVARKDLKSHRVAYVFKFGSIVEGVHILHRCDTPACVNHAHLMAGSQEDNIRDMLAKGRYRGGWKWRGEEHPQHKLSWEDVRLIRRLNTEQTLTQTELGNQFSVTQSQIGRILRNESWREDGI